MDIAKIRKKLKETEDVSQQSKVNSKAKKIQKDQNIKPDEEISELHMQPESPQEEPKPELIEAKAESEQKPVELIDKEQIKGKDERIETPVVEERVETGKTEEVIELLTFSLMKEEYAFRISQLKEIVKYQRITMVPKMPNYVLGITSLRGKVIPVIDLKLKLSLTDTLTGDNRKGKILIIKGPKGSIGVTVDKVIGVIRIAKSEMLPPPSHLSEAELKFIENVAIVDKRFVSIINMEEAIALYLK